MYQIVYLSIDIYLKDYLAVGVTENHFWYYKETFSTKFLGIVQDLVPQQEETSTGSYIKRNS